MKTLSTIALAVGLAISGTPAMAANDVVEIMQADPAMINQLNWEVTPDDVTAATTATIQFLPGTVQPDEIAQDNLYDIQQAAATNPSLKTVFENTNYETVDILAAALRDDGSLIFYVEEDVS